MIKAVIPAAGQGIRLLPITKEIPKEMLPVFCSFKKNKQLLFPLAQFIYEQLYSCGIRDYCFIVGRGKKGNQRPFYPRSKFFE